MKRIYTILILTVCVVSCTEDIYTGNPETDYIRFTPMEINTQRNKTRASLSTADNLTEYSVSASVYNKTSSYTSASCGSYWYNEIIETADGRTQHYWPGANYKVSFFAYAPSGNNNLEISSKDDIGYPRYQYTVPSAIEEQIDFITADILDHSGEGVEEPIPLAFSHRCADIRFKVYNKNYESITLHSIAMSGVKYKGTFSGNEWSLNDETNSTSTYPFMLSANEEIGTEDTIDVTGETQHFIMLPQVISSGTTIFEADVTVNGERKQSYYTLDADLEFIAGKSYLFTLGLGEVYIIVDEESDIQDWEVETKYMSKPTATTENTYTQPTVTDGADNGIYDWEINE